LTFHCLPPDKPVNIAFIDARFSRERWDEHGHDARVLISQVNESGVGIALWKKVSVDASRAHASDSRGLHIRERDSRRQLYGAREESLILCEPGSILGGDQGSDPVRVLI
jgi:hypothetical protein